MTSRSRGFGFVEMPDDEASKKAIAALDGTTIDGRTIKVTEARQKEQRSAPRDHTDGGYTTAIVIMKIGTKICYEAPHMTGLFSFLFI
jgi:RNA recognition motif-containing protein